MEYSSLILSYLDDENLRRELNPLVFYCLKMIYDHTFKRRSRYFSKALKRFFETLGNTLEVSIFNESAIENTPHKDSIMNESILLNMNQNLSDKENLNISINKECLINMSSLFSQGWEWSASLLYQADDEYILDKEDNYILLKLIKRYLFSDEDPKTSPLLTSYNIFVSSTELIYCLKLAENLPRIIFNPRENTKMEDSTQTIKYRIKLFYGYWIKLFKDKYEKNNLIKYLIGNSMITPSDENSNVDCVFLSKLEPILNSKYVSFTKLIREGPFCFEIEEVARQICILDHEILASLKPSDYNEFIFKKEAPESFTKFDIREKQIKCYILLFIFMHNNLDNKINLIQNFISLAHTCKLLQNSQTSYTIISALNLVGLYRKRLLWKLIEKEYREIFTNLEKDFNESEMNDNYLLESKNVNIPFVPHINRVKNTVNSFIIRMKNADPETLLKLSNEYKDFYVLMQIQYKQGYNFFKVNPLYDFFSFGFLEILKPKKWNLRWRIDFSQHTDDVNQLDSLLEFLIMNFRKLDN
jgi:hypothetical protein